MYYFTRLLLFWTEVLPGLGSMVQNNTLYNMQKKKIATLEDKGSSSAVF